MTPTPTEQEARDAFAHGAGHVTFESMRQCANAWLAVAAKLHEVAPGWVSRQGTGAECALEAIAALTRQEVQQEAQGAVCSPGEPAPPPSTPAQHYLAEHNGCASQDWQDGFNVCAHTAQPAPVDVRLRDEDKRVLEDHAEWLASVAKVQGGTFVEIERAFNRLLGGQPAGVDWRGHFVSTTEARYRDAGMKIEQARIHAENDARGLEAMHQAALGGKGDRETDR